MSENINNLKYGKYRFLMDTIERYGELPHIVKEMVTNKVDQIKINKGELLNDRFDLSTTIFFIQKGFIRCLTQTLNKEVTTWIASKGSFILGILEVYGEKKIKRNLKF